MRRSRTNTKGCRKEGGSYIKWSFSVWFSLWQIYGFVCIIIYQCQQRLNTINLTADEGISFFEDEGWNDLMCISRVVGVHWRLIYPNLYQYELEIRWLKCFQFGGGRFKNFQPLNTDEKLCKLSFSVWNLHKLNFVLWDVITRQKLVIL